MDPQDPYKEVKERLLELGAEQEELDEVIKDVNDVALQRVIKEYLQTLNDPEVNSLVNTASGPEVVEFFEKNVSRFPKLDEERLRAMVEKTWKEYFEFMEKASRDQ